MVLLENSLKLNEIEINIVFVSKFCKKNNVVFVKVFVLKREHLYVNVIV